jgi:hypothetical protein
MSDLSGIAGCIPQLAGSIKPGTVIEDGDRYVSSRRGAHLTTFALCGCFS